MCRKTMNILKTIVVINESCLLACWNSSLGDKFKVVILFPINFESLALNKNENNGCTNSLKTFSFDIICLS